MGPENRIGHIFEYERALNVLLYCSLRRRKPARAQAGGPIAPKTDSMSMKFEEREIKPYGEPVTSEQLEEGRIYFSWNYLDDDMLIPVLQPFVFVGRNLREGDSHQAYFQGAESYQQGMRIGSGPDGHADRIDSVPDGYADFFVGSENELGHIYEYERALDRLLHCALRRRKRLK
jgi:hypothetical protein